MSQRKIQTHQAIWGTDFPLNGEWDARTTPPFTTKDQVGRWSVRREAEHFIVIFHYFHDHHETRLAEYPPTEQGELDAKHFALTTEKK